MTTVLAAVIQGVVYPIAHGESFEAGQLFLVKIVCIVSVFVLSSAFWMLLRYVTLLQARLVECVAERDEFVRKAPKENGVLVTSIDALTSKVASTSLIAELKGLEHRSDSQEKENVDGVADIRTMMRPSLYPMNAGS